MWSMEISNISNMSKSSVQALLCYSVYGSCSPSGNMKTKEQIQMCANKQPKTYVIWMSYIKPAMIWDFTVCLLKKKKKKELQKNFRSERSSVRTE